MSSVFGSSKISLAHLLKFIAISIAIPFAVSTIEIEGEGGISGALGNRFTMSYSLSSLVIFWPTSPPPYFSRLGFITIPLMFWLQTVLRNWNMNFLTYFVFIERNLKSRTRVVHHPFCAFPVHHHRANSGPNPLLRCQNVLNKFRTSFPHEN